MPAEPGADIDNQTKRWLCFVKEYSFILALTVRVRDLGHMGFR